MKKRNPILAFRERNSMKFSTLDFTKYYSLETGMHKKEILSEEMKKSYNKTLITRTREAVDASENANS